MKRRKKKEEKYDFKVGLPGGCILCANISDFDAETKKQWDAYENEICDIVCKTGHLDERCQELAGKMGALAGKFMYDNSIGRAMKYITTGE